MRMPIVSPVFLAAAMFASAAWLSGCSSSDSAAEETPSEVASSVNDGVNSSAGEETNIDENDDVPVGVPAPVIGDGALADNDANPPLEDGTPLNAGVDPLIQNTTLVSFDIEVPVYQSDALQVRLTWGDMNIIAAWMGDEFWAVSAELPTNTTNLLSVFFNDDNGGITLGSFETDFRTGTNESESLQVSADQFDTASWDSDGDGVSNLDESIAGTNPLDAAGPLRVLLFSETQGFRHDSIPSALQALQELSTELGYETDLADDSAGVFTEANLANYDAVAWVLTSGDVLNDEEQAAFESFVRAGGGYVGIHAASDTEYDWPWYGDLVGAYFQRHPQIQSATMNVENGSHPSTEHLGTTWVRTDEWYDFRTNPRAQVNVLLTLDESTYTGGEMGEDHPIAWYHEFDGGRAWYTGGGHTVDSYAEADFRTHLIGGFRYALGEE